MTIDERIQDVPQQLRTDVCQGNHSMVVAQSHLFKRLIQYLPFSNPEEHWPGKLKTKMQK